jgi:cytochrome c oxidase subunit 3
MGGNPWGKLLDPSVAQQALMASSHETLAYLAHEYPKEGAEVALGALEKIPNDKLIGMIDLTHAHIRESGPIAFGGYFYGITGFHGFHVFSGVIINVVMLIMAAKGVFDRKGHYLMIEKAGLYWHFVDLVWVFVFLCFYLV